jgi:hypothetical protein
MGKQLDPLPLLLWLRALRKVPVKDCPLKHRMEWELTKTWLLHPCFPSVVKPKGKVTAVTGKRELSCMHN